MDCILLTDSYGVRTMNDSQFDYCCFLFRIWCAGSQQQLNGAYSLSIYFHVLLSLLRQRPCVDNINGIRYSSSCSMLCSMRQLGDCVLCIEMCAMPLVCILLAYTTVQAIRHTRTVFVFCYALRNLNCKVT